LDPEEKTDYIFDHTDRDPFAPLVSRSGIVLIPRKIDVTNMSLGGIIYSEKESIAIINDEVVKTGETIGDYRVVAIEENEVVLEKDDQAFTLKLEE